jgi:hypothetical protein
MATKADLADVAKNVEILIGQLAPAAHPQQGDANAALSRVIELPYCGAYCIEQVDRILELLLKLAKVQSPLD